MFAPVNLHTPCFIIILYCAFCSTGWGVLYIVMQFWSWRGMLHTSYWCGANRKCVIAFFTFLLERCTYLCIYFQYTQVCILTGYKDIPQLLVVHLIFHRWYNIFKFLKCYFWRLFLVSCCQSVAKTPIFHMLWSWSW